jgi:WD40 repeat protein/transcriptional regulator with XRE-family HTH domain
VTHLVCGPGIAHVRRTRSYGFRCKRNGWGPCGESPTVHPDDIATAEQLARELTALRERAGLTVRRLGAATGIYASTLGGYLSGRHSPPLDNLERVLAACGVTDPATVASWREALLRVRRRPVRRPRPEEAPYRGLEAFTDADAGRFFGRAALVAEIVDRIVAELATGPADEGETPPAGERAAGSVTARAGEGTLLVVTGASGSGKSSAVRAGVVPRLRERGLDVLVTTPGEPPLRRPDVLVVDQFEEAFSPRADEDALVGDLDGLAPVVVTVLRADFVGRALAHPPLARALRAPIVVGPPTGDELREVIVGPARQAGVEMEDGLPDLLLRDAAAPGALPLLSHALLATWDAAGDTGADGGADGRMTVAAYRATGGVARSVARTAEDVHAALGDTDAVRSLFLRLVQVSPDAPDTRRRVLRDELADVDPAVLEAFVDRRLLVAGPATVEIAHEALLVAWPRLREWVDADRAGLAEHRRFADAAAAWGASPDGDEDLLPRGAALAAAQDRAARRPGELTGLQQRFLAAAVALRDRAAAAARRRRLRVRAGIALLAVLTLVAGGLAAFAWQQTGRLQEARDLAVSRQLAVRADALRGRDPALAAQLAVAAFRVAPTDEARSSVIAASALPPASRLAGDRSVTRSVGAAGGVLVTAGGVEPGAEVWRLGERPERVATTPPGATPATVVALRSDGRLAAVTGTDGPVHLVDLAEPAHPVAAGGPLGSPGDAVKSLAFSPDGHTLVAGTAAGKVHRFAVTDPAAPAALPDMPGPAVTVAALAWSPDGTLLAGGDTGGAGWLWRGGAAPARLDGATGSVNAVAFSPDGHTLALGSADRAVHLWDVTAAPARGADLTGPTNWVDSVAFSPDGASVAAGSADATVRVWALASRQVVATLPHPGPVTAAAYLDARTLVTAEAGGIPRIWTVPGPVVSGLGDSVFAVGFTADGRSLAVGPGSRDGSAGLWDPSGPSGVALRGRAVNPAGEPKNSGSAAVTPDGRTLAVGRTDGSVRLFDTSDPTRPVPRDPVLHGTGSLVEQVAAAPGGRLVAASGDDGLVRLWDLTRLGDGTPIATLRDAGSYVLASAFSPDARLLAGASADHRTYVWSIADPTAPRLLARIDGPDSYAYSPAWSPDGRTLAVGAADRVVRLYDVTDPARPSALGAPLTGPDNYVYSVAWSPDGATLAAASTDSTVRLWDVSDVRAPVRLATLEGAGDAVFSVAWSPDSTTLAAGGADKSVRLYTADPVRATAAICAHAGSPVTETEWAKYVPDLPYAPPC